MTRSVDIEVSNQTKDKARLAIALFDAQQSQSINAIIRGNSGRVLNDLAGDIRLAHEALIHGKTYERTYLLNETPKDIARVTGQKL